MISLRVSTGVLALVVALTTGAVLLPQAAEAHTIATAGSLEVLLHVDPDDQPRSSEPATLYVSFSDSSGRFNLAQCACRLEVSRNGQSLSSGALKPDPGSRSLALYPITFARPGVYHVALTGRPAAGSSWAKFAVGYDLRVEPGKAPATVLGTYGWPAAGAGIAAVVGLGGWRLYRRRRQATLTPPVGTA